MMDTQEDAKAQGEKLREILLQLALKYNDIIPMLNGTAHQQRLKEFIEGIVDTVHKEILPQYTGREISLYEEGRSLRSFEVEYQRLWTRAFTLYFEYYKTAIPEVENLWHDSVNANLLNELQDVFCKQVQSVTIPLLERYESIGEDFYLYINELMHNLDLDATIENIAETKKTPPQLEHAFLGMFGLLIQAMKAKQQGDMGRAYTFLLDANHLIGMHEGARFAMKHLPAVAVKLRAKTNAAKSHIGKDKVKKRAAELFYSLRPTGEDGKPKKWDSINLAIEAIWDQLVVEAMSEGKLEPGIQESTIRNVCNKLINIEKEGSSLDIHIEVVQVLPDGTTIKIPL